MTRSTSATLLGIALLVLVTRPAHAASRVCDPVGHFCVQVDVPGARICNVLARPLDPKTCNATDAKASDALAAAGAEPLITMFVRRSDPNPVDEEEAEESETTSILTVARDEEQVELRTSSVKAHVTKTVAQLATQGVRFDLSEPATLERIHDVQVVGYRGQVTQKGSRLAGACAEIFARDGFYFMMVLASTEEEAVDLRTRVLGTLEAQPAGVLGRGGRILLWAIAGLLVVVGAIAAWGIAHTRRRRAASDSKL